MGDESSETESSEDEPETQVDLDEADIKLAQMRRKARANAAGKSKLLDKFAGLQSYDDMMREHALNRMVEGLTSVLKLHTAPELSSICGTLGLPAKEKGSTSLKLILQYASKDGVLNAERISKLLSYMWEGALFEYLRSIGHPVHTMFLDPKDTVLAIWQQGGMLTGGSFNTFVPHFIAREVKKRNEWVNSTDILHRLDKLREMQESTKRAEQEIMTTSDFNNIVAYFRKMGDLRNYENSVREYVISELEMARARLDSVDETARMMRDDLADCERKVMTLSDALNEQCAYAEHTAEMCMMNRFEIEGQLQRLLAVVESYVAAEEDRQESGGGSAQALQLRNIDDCSPTIRALHGKMQAYRDMRDEADENLRERSRAHIAEIDRLEEVVRKLEDEVNNQTRRANNHEKRADAAEADVQYCARKMIKMKIREEVSSQEAWASSLRWALRCTDLEGRKAAAKRLILAGIQDKEKVVVQLCYALNNILEIASKDQIMQTEESILMGRADGFSSRHRKYLKGLAAPKKAAEPKKAKKTVVSTNTAATVDSEADAESTTTSTKGGAKGGGKKKGGGGGEKKGSGKKGGKGGGDDESKASSKASAKAPAAAGKKAPAAADAKKKKK